MRVLHIISGLGNGGAEAVLFNLCQSDKQNNHIVISLLDEGKYGSLLKEIGVEVYPLNFSYKRLNFFAFLRLIKLIRQIMPDVVQTWMIHSNIIGGLAAKLIGIEKIFWGIHQTTLSNSKTKPMSLLITKINAFFSNIIPTKIIYCAEKSREDQEAIGFKKTKGEVIQNGYNVENFCPKKSIDQTLRNELGISNDSPLLGYVGRYHPMKDLGNLIRSLTLLNQNLKNVNAVLVGSNIDHNNKELMNLIDEYKLNHRVHLVGERNDISSFMNSIDLLVLCSSYGEAFPNVLNEAMSCGTPCVTTNIGDSALIVGNTGWVIPPNDSDALAQAINKALEEKQSNQKLWIQREKDCRNRVINNFSLEMMTKKYLKLWTDGIN